ncbi:MAG: hypothetical protein AAF657_13555 [Acidobacteriota bacterium]
MEILRDVLRWTHVILGFTGLIAFWFPVFARKGGTIHRRVGKVFVWCGYGVTASAFVSCGVHTWMIFATGIVEQNRANLAFLAMLAYLAVVTFVTLHHAMRVLGPKRDPTLLDQPLDRSLAYAAIAASLGLIAFALLQPTDRSILLIAMSPIGLSVGWGILRYIRGTDPSTRAWFYAHMGATLGAGVAFHTAFAVFGAARLFDLHLSGFTGMLPWLLPAAIGIPAGSLWERYYRRKFGDLPPKGAAAAAAGDLP